MPEVVGMAKSMAEMAASATAAHSKVSNSTPAVSVESPALLPAPNAKLQSRRKLPELLEAIEVTIRRYVMLPSDSAAHVLALFVAHSYAIDGADTTPYIAITSAEKRSGKTRLLEVLGVLCSNPWQVANPSEAVLFRKIGNASVTLLWDEVDTVWSSPGERTAPLRGVLNAGYKRGGSVPRCVGQSMDEVRDFPVFGPKVLCGIDDSGKWPDTVLDRSLEIVMTRRVSSERVERFKESRLRHETESLREEIAMWASQPEAIEALSMVEPDLPAVLDDRKAEIAEPLFAIADMAQGEWPELARSSVVELATRKADESASKGTLVLTKMASVFGDRQAVATQEILDALNEDDDLPFGGYSNGMGINSRSLSRLLRPYSVRSKTVRTFDGTPKGYHRDDLEDVWARYVPTLEKGQQAQQAQHATNPQQQTPHEQRDVADVADVADIHPQGQLSPESATFDRNATADEEAEAERLLTLLEGGGA